MRDKIEVVGGRNEWRTIAIMYVIASLSVVSMALAVFL
jgi:hypothetical protein